MPHVLVAGRLHPAGTALLERAPGVTFDLVDEVSEPSYAPLIDRADGLVIRTQPLSAATVARGLRLGIVSRHGVGFDAVDVEALSARGIPLTVVGDVNSVSVAEHAMMLLLAAAKRMVRADAAVRQGDWGWRNLLEAREVSGRNLLLLGYGRIARHLARMAGGFGMQVRAYDPYLERLGWPEGDVRPASDLREGLAWADFVSVSVPKADRPLLGAAEIAAMRPGAILVNTARGGVVDEAALAAALADGRLAGAGLDVFDDEPPGPGNLLVGLDRAVLSPHIAGLTLDAAERMAISAVQNVLDHFEGRLDTSLVVNGASLHAV